MAQCRQFACSACGYTIDAWDEGNPYVLKASGRKRYVYHPDHDRELAVGIDDPHLCLACGRKFNVDSRKPRSTCPKCQSDQISDTFNLDGKPRPKCSRGSFVLNPDFSPIS